MNAQQTLPMVPGWDVHHHGDGLWVAHRVHGLTEYMKRFGALVEVAALNLDELVVLCDAQTRLGERLATAEWLYRRAEVFRQAASQGPA